MGRVGDDDVHTVLGHQRDEVGQRRPVQGDGFVERLRPVGGPRRSGSLAVPLDTRSRAASWTSAGWANALFASLTLTRRSLTA